MMEEQVGELDEALRVLSGKSTGLREREESKELLEQHDLFEAKVNCDLSAFQINQPHIRPMIRLVEIRQLVAWARRSTQCWRMSV